MYSQPQQPEGKEEMLAGERVDTGGAYVRSVVGFRSQERVGMPPYKYLLSTLRLAIHSTGRADIL